MRADYRILATALAIFGFGASAAAQEPLEAGALEPAAATTATVVEVQTFGERAGTLTIRTVDMKGLELLALLARKADHELALEGETPAALAHELDQRTATVDLRERSFEETLSLLGAALGVHVRLDVESRRLVVARVPDAAEPAAAEFFRRQAIDSTRTAFFANAEDTELLLRAARLEVAGGDLEAAWKSFGRFLETPRVERHPAAPRACLDAARCALVLGRPVDAWRVVDRFFRNFPGHPDLVKAEILGAEARILERSWADAIRLLRSIQRDVGSRSIDDRDGLVAELLLAEVYWRLGQFDQALSVLEQGPSRRSRKHRDLLDAMPLYVGYCRRAQGDLAAAVIEFRTAARLAPRPAQRLRAMIAQVETLLELGSPGEALMAARVALKLESAGDERVRLLHLLAQAQGRLGLVEAALGVLHGVVEEIEGLQLGEADRLARSSVIFAEIADLYVADGRGEEAVAWLDRAAADPALRTRALLTSARCELASNRPRAALERLDALVELEIDDAMRAETSRLRGDAFMALDLFERAVEAYGEDR